MEICPENPADVEAIRQVTTAAFKSAEHSSGTEAAIVDALRTAGALTISLVAVVENEVIGHIAFSPIRIDGADRGWYGLGPVSVLPGFQKKGIGQSLVREGLRRLAELAANGFVVLGEPLFYQRFGFQSDPALRYQDVPVEYFMRLVIAGTPPSGRVAYHAGFDAA